MQSNWVAKERILSVDILRGWVMIIMALDHIRDYTTNAHFDPTDLDYTTPALFFTRWITHFCAPVFMFVAGIGTGLGFSRGKSKGELAHFLITRGAWLVLLEFTIISFAWWFRFNMDAGLILIVIWALGMSMIFLAGLIYLPKWMIVAIGLTMVFGHNLLDDVQPEAFGAFSWIWKVLHMRARFELLNVNVSVVYPLIPWIGVMALGYVFADLFRRSQQERIKLFLVLGGAITLLFVALRWLNVYGDPHPWQAQETPLFTLMSLLNTTKYPPSLMYLLMTLGPSIILLALFEYLSGPVARFLLVFGRVPLFFYVLHLYLIHLIALVAGKAQGFSIQEMSTIFVDLPSDYGFSLPVVYLFWIFVIFVLYWPSRWWMGVKKRNKHAIFSYL